MVIAWQGELGQPACVHGTITTNISSTAIITCWVENSWPESCCVYSEKKCTHALSWKTHIDENILCYKVVKTGRVWGSMFCFKIIENTVSYAPCSLNRKFQRYKCQCRLFCCDFALQCWMHCKKWRKTQEAQPDTESAGIHLFTFLIG